MHDRATDVPPGYYLMFVFNGNGVPSVGKIVRIGLPGSGGGQDTVAPSKPANFNIKLVNKDPQLSFTPSTDNVGVVGYSVYRSTNGKLGGCSSRSRRTRGSTLPRGRASSTPTRYARGMRRAT